MAKRYHLTLVFFMLILSAYSLDSQAQSGSTKHKPLIQLWENKTNDEWQVFRKVEYKYDDQKRLVEEKTLAAVPEGFNPLNRLRWMYNEKGDLAKVIRETWNGEGWIFATQSRYEYRSDRIASRKDSALQNGVLSLIDVEYAYDDKERVEEEISRKVQYDKRANQSKVVYHYDQNDLPVEKEYPIWSGSEWSKARKMTLKYDERGNHIETTRFNWTDNEWVLFVHYDLTIDAQGRRVKEMWKRPGEEGISNFMRISYRYEN